MYRGIRLRFVNQKVARSVLSQLTHAQRYPLSVFDEDKLLQFFETVPKDAANTPSTHYEYDAAGRLIHQINPQQLSKQYTYDAQGNVLSTLEGDANLWVYQYDEANQLIESRSPKISVYTEKGQEQRSIITRNHYDSFGNLIEVIRDAQGLAQITRYEFDVKQQKTKTIYPDVAVNNASALRSDQRQEILQTLTEEHLYNAFSERIASKDKAGEWTHYAYNEQGLMRYAVDRLGGLTEYQYDNLGRLTTTIRYAQALNVDKDFDYSIRSISLQKTSQESDRLVYSVYNRDNQLIEVRQTPQRTYDASKNQYDYLAPITKTTYNAFGEVIRTSKKMHSQEWADTYYYYDKEGNQTACIDALGYATTYQYTVLGKLESMTEYATAARTWDSEHYTPPEANSQDRTQCYTYDLLGQLTSKTLKQVRFERLKPNSNTYESLRQDLTTRYNYDGLGHLTATTDAQGNTAYCYYDNLGQVVAKVGPKTAEGQPATTYSYDGLGHVVETRNWAKGARFADAQSFQLYGASSEDIRTQQQYDSQGLLISQIDGNEQRTDYSYDVHGNVARSWQTLHSIKGLSYVVDKRYAYDKEQHVLQTTIYQKEQECSTEEAQYNVWGELTAKGWNGHYTTHIEYDAAGRVWRSNAQGFYQIFVYDLAGNLTQVVCSTNDNSDQHGASGIDLSTPYFDTLLEYNSGPWALDLQRQNNTYDALGRLIQQSKAYAVISSSSEEVRHLEYQNHTQQFDRWGNKIAYTDALGYETTYEYNDFNQVIRQELPAVQSVDEHGVVSLIHPVTWYAYDELGQAIARKDANGHTLSKEYDAFGRIILERDAKGNTRSKSYNLLGDLSQTVNELGGVTHYTYDKEHRVLQVETPKTHQQYAYDEAGQLIQQKQGGTETTEYEYDPLGHQIARTDARGNTTHFEYDAAGHKTLELDAEGHSLSWTYDEDGRLTKHRDLGGHVTEYTYNRNGLLMEEHSTQGKAIQYAYQGNGDLVQYYDTAYNEIIQYNYDVEGQLVHKKSSRGDTLNDGWIMENDHYEYDSLGRLRRLLRTTPENNSPNAPPKDNTLLYVEYDYDAVGNIRHTLVNANYLGASGARIQSEDYYLYDETDRMTLNKGALVDGSIVLTKGHGSSSTYDAAGNIKTSSKYENGVLEQYNYIYNQDSQLELIQKKGVSLQSKYYDSAGHVVREEEFDPYGKVAQSTLMSYDKGLLQTQRTSNRFGQELSTTTFHYDKMGHVGDVITRINPYNGQIGSTLTHTYQYALWDDYQQSEDVAVQRNDWGATSTATSTRYYDANGQLKVSTQGNDTITYSNSSMEGLRGRRDKDGQTSYMHLQGKTIGTLVQDIRGNQELTVYGGFTPTGSHQKGAVSTPWEDARQPEAILPEAPQDNLGAYTVEAGDTLEHIALKVYGDSSLWHLLADANGVSDRTAQAGSSAELHVGQRLMIPPVAISQHQNKDTHKVLNAYELLGNSSATPSAPLLAYPPPRARKNSVFGKIVVAVVSTVATVLTAGAVGALVGAAQAGATLFGTGLALLGGKAGLGLGASLAAGFSAGFIGNLASQSASKALGMQEGIDLKNALATGLATAATGGLLQGINSSSLYTQAAEKLNNLSLSQTFSLTHAAQLMEENAISQAINLSLTPHQHFDWEQLGIAGLTAGFMAATPGQKIHQTLSTLDHHTGILTQELTALATTAAETAGHFNATEVLKDNLGTTIAENLIAMGTEQTPTQPEVTLENPEDLYLTSTVLSMIHPERTTDQLYMHYLAKQLSGSEGYGELSTRTEKVGEPIQAKEQGDLISREQLKQMFPRAKQKVLDAYLPELNKQLDAAGINTPRRLAFFFCTVDEETGGMTEFTENNFLYRDLGRARRLFHDELGGMSLKEIKALGHGERFANVIYAHKNGNGDASTGDGYLFRGRGLFNYTGRGNYKTLGGIELVKNPDLVLSPKKDVYTAIKYWDWRGLSKKVDVLNTNIKIVNEKVNDHYFKEAVAQINPRLININKRATSFNQYIKLNWKD